MTPITMIEAVIWPPTANRVEIARVAAFTSCVANREAARPRGHMNRRTRTATKAHETRHLAAMRSAAETNKAASILKCPPTIANRRSAWPLNLVGQAPKGAIRNIVGGVASPLLANVFLHYVFDLWVQQWRTRNATGDVKPPRHPRRLPRRHRTVPPRNRRRQECMFAWYWLADLCDGFF